MPDRQQFIARVVGNTSLCREHYRLTLWLDQSPPTRAGQFVQVGCRDVELEDGNHDHGRAIEHEWSLGQPIEFFDADLLSPTAMLRRPFSLASRRDDASGAVELEIIH